MFKHSGNTVVKTLMSLKGHLLISQYSRILTTEEKCGANLLHHAEEDVPSTSAPAVLAGEDKDYIEMKGIRLTGTPLYLDMQVFAVSFNTSH